MPELRELTSRKALFHVLEKVMSHGRIGLLLCSRLLSIAAVPLASPGHAAMGAVEGASEGSAPTRRSTLTAVPSAAVAAGSGPSDGSSAAVRSATPEVASLPAMQRRAIKATADANLRAAKQQEAASAAANASAAVSAPAKASAPAAANASVASNASAEANKTNKTAAAPTESCHYLFGLPKMGWAIVCDVLALMLILVCIPLLLACSRRRPPGAPIFDSKVCSMCDDASRLVCGSS